MFLVKDAVVWRIIGAALLLFVLTLVVGLVPWLENGNPRFFFAFVAFSTLILYAATFLVVWDLLASVVWKLLPGDLREVHLRRKLRFKLIVFTCLVFFISVGLIINKMCLPGKSEPQSIVGDICLAGLAVVLGRALFLGGKAIYSAVAAAGAFTVLIVLLALVTPGEERALYNRHVKDLTSLGYITWAFTERTNLSGVSYHDTTRVCPGLNIYKSDNRASARLFSNSGDLIHEWSAQSHPSDVFWDVEMCPNGDLLAIKSGEETPMQLIRLDWDSNLLWSVDGRYHHDICVAENGDIYTIVRKDEVVSFRGIPLPIVNDYIAVLSSEGVRKRTISLYELINDMPKNLLRDVYVRLIRPKGWRWLIDLAFKSEYNFVQGRHSPLSPFHANAVELIKKDTGSIFSKGDILFGIRNMHFIGVTNSEGKDVVFSWGEGYLQGPHNPTQLENGNLLIFDNGVYRNSSRIVELNPVTRQVVWTYEAETPESFCSKTKGACQRLMNGNTLITNSNSGQVFEVTNDGKIVWEFYNPEIDEKTDMRATIYRCVRIDDPKSFPGLAAVSVGTGSKTGE